MRNIPRAVAIILLGALPLHAQTTPVERARARLESLVREQAAHALPQAGHDAAADVALISALADPEAGSVRRSSTRWASWVPHTPGTWCPRSGSVGCAAAMTATAVLRVWRRRPGPLAGAGVAIVALAAYAYWGTRGDLGQRNEIRNEIQKLERAVREHDGSILGILEASHGQGRPTRITEEDDRDHRRVLGVLERLSHMRDLSLGRAISSSKPRPPWPRAR